MKSTFKQGTIRSQLSTNRTQLKIFIEKRLGINEIPLAEDDGFFVRSIKTL
jgi:hypothetical protein